MKNGKEKNEKNGNENKQMTNETEKLEHRKCECNIKLSTESMVCNKKHTCRSSLRHWANEITCEERH